VAYHDRQPLLRYDRNITAPFLEDDSLFILDHFPSSTLVYAYDLLDTTVGVATILSIWSFIVDTVLSLLWAVDIPIVDLRFMRPRDCLFHSAEQSGVITCDDLYSS
jgi:hypothetical protein